MSFKPHQSFIPDRVSRANQPGLGPYNNVHAYISHSRQPLHVGSSDHATSTVFWNQEPHTPDLDAVHGSPSPFDPSANASRLLSASSRTQFSTQPTNSANDCMRSCVQVRRSGATAMDLGPHTHSNDEPCSTSLMSLDRVTAPKHFNSERALGDPSPSSLPRLIDTEYESNYLICNWNGCTYAGGFSRKGSLWRHIQDKHLPPEIECSMCPETFGRKDKYNQHLRRAHSDIALR